MARRILVLVLLGAGFFGAAFAGHAWWTRWRHLETTDNAAVEADIVTVAPQVSGIVDAVAVVDNQAVRAGDVLVRIADAAFKARVAQAKAALDTAIADRIALDAERGLADAGLIEARAAVEAADAVLAQARSDAERARELARTQNISTQAAEQAETTLRRAAASVEQSRAAVASAEARIRLIDARAARLEAEAAGARALLSEAELDLAHTEIRAPFDGVVGNRGVVAGQFVRPGTPLLALVPLPAVHVVANFKETQIAGLGVGLPVEISIDAWPDLPVRGRISGFAPAVGSRFSLLPPENATGNFTKIVQRVPVRIEIEDPGALAGLLRPGLSVEVTVDTSGRGSGGSAAAGPVFGVADVAAGQ